MLMSKLTADLQSDRFASIAKHCTFMIALGFQDRPVWRLRFDRKRSGVSELQDQLELQPPAADSELRKCEIIPIFIDGICAHANEPHIHNDLTVRAGPSLASYPDHLIRLVWVRDWM